MLYLEASTKNREEQMSERENAQQAMRSAEPLSMVGFGTLLGTVLAVSLLNAPPAHGEIFYQTGFEQPTFHPGAHRWSGGDGL